MEHSTEILYNKTEVYCSAVHRFGSDALLLARFCEPRRSQKAADLCSGCGIVSLEWHDRGHRGPCAAVELQPEASALLQEAVAAQGIGHITPYLADLCTFREGEGQFDVCACNPPYFTGGRVSPDTARAGARHELSCTMPDVCAAAGLLLKDGGRLCVCQRPERLADVLCAMRGARIEPKRLQFVMARPEKAPWLVLVEGQKNRAPGLRVPAPLVTARADGRPSAAMLEIYGTEPKKEAP